MSKYIGQWFFYDDDISIYWNRGNTLNVWNNGKEVNCFTVTETMTPKRAELVADEWLAEQLEEEKLRHADINYSSKIITVRQYVAPPSGVFLTVTKTTALHYLALAK